MSGKKLMCFLLAISMAVLTGCGRKQTQNTEPGLHYTDPYAELAGDHDGRSEAIYGDILGEFFKHIFHIYGVSEMICGRTRS